MDCAGTSDEICGGRDRMSLYSIDCYYPDGFAVETPYESAGCFVDSNSNRVLPAEGDAQDTMSTVVRH